MTRTASSRRSGSISIVVLMRRESHKSYAGQRGFPQGAGALESHSTKASTRSGLPLPLTILSGAAMTTAPAGGSWSRLRRLARPNFAAAPREQPDPVRLESVVDHLGVERRDRHGSNSRKLRQGSVPNRRRQRAGPGAWERRALVALHSLGTYFGRSTETPGPWRVSGMSPQNVAHPESQQLRSRSRKNMDPLVSVPSGSQARVSCVAVPDILMTDPSLV